LLSLKEKMKSKTGYCNHSRHTAVIVCSQCGIPVCENCWHHYGGEYICKSCRKKQGVQFSRGFVYLSGIVLFFIVFSSIIIFGSKYAASESSMPEADFDCTSYYLWLNEYEFNIENTLPDNEIVCLRPFTNLGELKQFLETDLTDEQVYSKDFDCDDFAFMLSQNAMNKGLQIFPFAEDDHLKNVAHVTYGDTIVVYAVEPQTDELQILGKID
jgi:hypothetical protein